MSKESDAGPSKGQAANQTDSPQALKTWWSKFKRQGGRGGEQKGAPVTAKPGIFGVPLVDSIKYANVKISLLDDQGKSFTYGYVPIVVAKCGVFLKEKATDVEGIFRLNGSAKRIKELQLIFDSPDRYGKGLDWNGFTVHDAANVLRRYLNQLPQPLVPLDAYERFREPLRDHFDHSSSDGAVVPNSQNFNHDQAIATYQRLIKELPHHNCVLLLYILDLLAVFASKSEVNLMTSANLAAIFQPGVLSHPDHNMEPAAYRLSQDVLIFLIDNQDSFLVGMSGTAADENTVREVSEGAIPQQPSTPIKSGLGRSVSNASTTGEGKRFSGVRRNVSTSSRNSRQSSQGPGTPLSGQFGLNSGVFRSNTVPSKKSPGLPGARFNRGLDSPNTPIALSPSLGGLSNHPAISPAEEKKEPAPTVTSAQGDGLGFSSTAPTAGAAVTVTDRTVSNDRNTTDQSPFLSPQAKSRKVSDVLLNLTAGPDKDGRQPNKLKKKRLPSNMSGNSSAASLVGAEQSTGFPPSRSPLRTPDILSVDQNDPMTSIVPDQADITPTANDGEPKTPTAATTGSKSLEIPKSPDRPGNTQKDSQVTLRARSGSRHSGQSRSSVTDLSEVDPDQTEEARNEQKEKRRRWRFSTSAKKSKSPARVGSDAGGQSSSSIGSWHRSRKSISNDTNPSLGGPVPSLPGTTTVITGGSESRSKTRSKSKDPSLEKDTEEEKEEKRGFFDKLRKKVGPSRDNKRERDAEKERTKTPERDAEKSASKQSLPGIAAESTSPRKSSVVEQTIPEQTENETTTTSNIENQDMTIASAVASGFTNNEEAGTQGQIAAPASVTSLAFTGTTSAVPKATPEQTETTQKQETSHVQSGSDLITAKDIEAVLPSTVPADTGITTAADESAATTNVEKTTTAP